jgi:hypothetical protein
MSFAAIDRNATALLVGVLALFYILLGASSPDLAGVLGIVGGAAILGVLVFRGRLGHLSGFAILVVATLPFALLTWWSVAVPVIGALVILIGWTASRQTRAH